MSKQRDALLMALEWIEAQPEPRMIMGAETMRAIREALAEPEQEPVAWMCSDESMTHKGYTRFARTKNELWNIPVYTTPPPRKPLTDAEIFNTAADYYEGYGFKALEFARAIERAHGIGES